jgi:hypothetical protein
MRYTKRDRTQALQEFSAELAEFSYDGLQALLADLEDPTTQRPYRGTWQGCPISYKRGEAGSARRDRLGRARNAFTVLWDNGWLTDAEVAAAVREEIERRTAHLPAPEPVAEPVAATA